MGRGWKQPTAGDLLGDLPLSCIDGRHGACVVAAPGGNAGELVVLLAAAEAVLGRRLDVASVFDAYLARFGRFYLHSDSHAAGRLIARAAGIVGEDPPTEDLGQLLRHPPEAWKAALRAHLVDPAHVGCGHLAAMLRDPGGYRVPRELVEGVIRAFHEAAWRGESDAELGVLEGHHEEREVVVFDAPRAVDETTRLPLACPGGVSAFAYHPGAVRFTRRQAARWLAQHLAGGRRPEPALVDAIARAEGELGQHHLDRTLGALARGLPLRRVPCDEGPPLPRHTAEADA